MPPAEQSQHYQELARIVSQSRWFMPALRAVRSLELRSWCIGAGAIRNLVWDELHGYEEPSAIADVDVAYFDPNIDPDRDQDLQSVLHQQLPSVPWEVTIQAFVHNWFEACFGHPVEPLHSLEAALNAAHDAEVAAWEKRLRDAEVRGASIYLDAYFGERDKGIDEETARMRANNALTRAGLQRLDRVIVGKQRLTKRDREIRDMENAILKRHEDEMTPEEREQLELLREHEKAVLANRKKRGW